MLHRPFGTTGLSVSALGFGGAEIGFQKVDQETVTQLLNAALDQGLNVIDTAECYADSEEKIGHAVSHRRDEFHLFTKCGHSSDFEEPDWTPSMLAATIDRSLQRLKTDHLDLVQLHTCGRNLLEQGDVIDVLLRAKEAGKTRLIGYSGDSVTALYAVETEAFDSLQISVNVADQECLDLAIPAAVSRGMGIIAKRPVANVAWMRGQDPNTYGHTYYNRLQTLAYPFLSQPDAVATALRFTYAQLVSTMIVGTTRADRWAENAAVLAQGPLPNAEVEAIRARWAEVATPDWVGQT